MELRDLETWVLAGDSITQGVVHTNGRFRWVDYLHDRLYQVGRPRDLVVNTGVSGWTAQEVLADYATRVGRWQPTIVSYSLGTNDSHSSREVTVEQFRDALAELVTRAQADGARTVLQTPICSPAALRHGRDLPPYIDVVRELAEQTGSVLVDHDAHWQQLFAGGEPTRWMNDSIHPDGDGHREMAQLMLRTLGIGEWQPWPPAGQPQD